MNESFHSVTDEDPLESLRSSVHEFSDSFHSALSTSDIDKRLTRLVIGLKSRKRKPMKKQEKKSLRVWEM